MKFGKQHLSAPNQINLNCKKTILISKKKSHLIKKELRSYLEKHFKDYREDSKKKIEAYMSAETRQGYNNNLQQYFFNDDVKDILARTKELTKNMPGNKN